jgi:hypothetical protein
MLNFKGDKPEKVGVFDYSCKTPNKSSWSGQHVLLDTYGSYRTQGGGNGYVFKKGDKFYLTINWSGQMETIEIK